MNYLRHYNRLIERAKTRTHLEGYTEKHHIIPRCMGGTNEPENLVRLYADEHYIAHLLLVKIYPHNHKLIYAANMMCVGHKGKRTNKRHKWLREELSKAHSIRMKGHKKSKETREKLSKALKGLKKPPHFGLQQSARQLGRKLDQSTKDKISLAHKGKTISDEHKKKLSECNSGERNSMFGKLGSDHPAFGIKVWRTHLSAKDKETYKYYKSVYDYIQYDKLNPFNKKTGHKRLVKDFCVVDNRSWRNMVESIVNNNFNPYNEPDFDVWLEENNYVDDIDASLFEFPKSFLLAISISKFVDSIEFKSTYNFNCNISQEYKDSEFPISQIQYIADKCRNGWNPLEDTKFLEWKQKWDIM